MHAQHTFDKILATITPEICEQLKRAVELGKWANGSALSQQQRALCLQAVIAYEQRHLPPGERSGDVPTKKTRCQPSGDDSDTTNEQPLRFDQS
ncbi:MAG: YeaC family protein [Cellvibrionaceae bacterium]|nr:YeaC family protein [Cellvibrionaceae bacterium]